MLAYHNKLQLNSISRDALDHYQLPVIPSVDLGEKKPPSTSREMILYPM